MMHEKNHITFNFTHSLQWHFCLVFLKSVQHNSVSTLQWPMTPIWHYGYLCIAVPPFALKDIVSNWLIARKTGNDGKLELFWWAHPSLPFLVCRGWMRNCLRFVCVANSCPLTFDLNSQKSGLTGSRCKGEVHTQVALWVNRANELSQGFKSQLCYLWEWTFMAFFWVLFRFLQSGAYLMKSQKMKFFQLFWKQITIWLNHQFFNLIKWIINNKDIVTTVKWDLYMGSSSNKQRHPIAFIELVNTAVNVMVVWSMFLIFPNSLWPHLTTS